MRTVWLTILALAACKTSEGEVYSAHIKTIDLIITTVNDAQTELVTPEQKMVSGAMVDVEIDDRTLAKMSREEALFVVPASTDEQDAYVRCTKILELGPDRVEDLNIDTEELEKRLRACEHRYVVVIMSEKNDTGVFHVWDAPAHRRIITVLFPTTPSRLREDAELAYRKMLALEPSHPPA